MAEDFLDALYDFADQFELDDDDMELLRSYDEYLRTWRETEAD